MTTRKTTTRKTRKTPAQTASNYRTVRVMKKTRKQLADKVDGYNDRFIQKPIESTRTFIKDLKADPRKALDKLADDSREQIADVRKDARRKVDGYLKDGRKFYRRARKDPRKTLGSLIEDSRVYVEDLGSDTGDRVKNLCQEGRKLAEMVEKDGRMVADRLQTAGKEALENRFGKKSAGTSEPLLIKKYVNGRFYDTVNKKYLKKADLAQLVEKGTDLKIIYTKTGRNVTRSVLAGLDVKKSGGKQKGVSLDAVASRLKENRERIREAFERQLKTVRKAVKLPA